jgi:hypothetical protein
MANNATFQKRQKERARQQKQRDKAARRLEAKKHREQLAPRSAGTEDPDIVGIQPGPQPLPAQWLTIDQEE